MITASSFDCQLPGRFDPYQHSQKRRSALWSGFPVTLTKCAEARSAWVRLCSFDLCPQLVIAREDAWKCFAAGSVVPASTEPKKAIAYSSSCEYPSLHALHTSTTGRSSGYSFRSRPLRERDRGWSQPEQSIRRSECTTFLLLVYEFFDLIHKGPKPPLIMFRLVGRPSPTSWLIRKFARAVLAQRWHPGYVLGKGEY